MRPRFNSSVPLVLIAAALMVTAQAESPMTCSASTQIDALPPDVEKRPLTLCVVDSQLDPHATPLKVNIPASRRYQTLAVSLLAHRRVVLAPRISLIRTSDQKALGVWTIKQFLNRGGVLTARIALPPTSADTLSLVIAVDNEGLSDPKLYSVSSPLASPEFFFTKDLQLNIAFARSGRLAIRGM